MEYLDFSRPSFKINIRNLTSFLSVLIENRCLPSQRLILEVLSENQIASGEHASRSLKELFKYAGGHTYFLTEKTISEFSQFSIKASLRSLNLGKQANSNPAAPVSCILDPENLAITSHTDYPLSPIDMKNIDISGKGLFSINAGLWLCMRSNDIRRVQRWDGVNDQPTLLAPIHTQPSHIISAQAPNSLTQQWCSRSAST